MCKLRHTFVDIHIKLTLTVFQVVRTVAAVYMVVFYLTLVLFVFYCKYAFPFVSEAVLADSLDVE